MSTSDASNDAKDRPGPQSKYDYKNGPPPVTVNMKWCKACNICIALCPKEVFEPNRDGKPIIARAENCTQCTICWVHCPDLAITSNYK